MVKVRVAKAGRQALNYLRTEPRSEEVSLSIVESPPSIGIADLDGASVDRYEERDPPIECDEGTHQAALAIAGGVLRADIAPAALPHPGDATPSGVATAMPVLQELRGRIETATNETIRGWVWDPQMPDKRIRLELVEGDKQLEVAVADEFRHELVPLGCGDGRYGFDIGLEDGLLSEDQHVLTLRCADTGAAMPGSPIVLNRQPTAAAPGGSRLDGSASGPKPEFRAYIDKVTDTGILGWIMRPDQPSHRYVVALMEGERVLARAAASQFRQDLMSAGAGDGCYAFTFAPPPSVLDGEEHILHIVEEKSGVSISEQTIRWRSAVGTGQPTPSGLLPGTKAERPSPLADFGNYRSALKHTERPDGSHRVRPLTAPFVGTRILFDISDLVYYIGHHANLTGIQRVQSSIVLAMVDGKEFPPASMIFLSFNAATRNWVAIPTGFLISLLRDLFLPEPQRLVDFSAEAARDGVLPGAQPFDGIGVLDDGNQSVLCLLGAAWVHQDYIHRVLALKRQFGTRFVMTIHDLIPIYARDTCDQDTTRVFEEFMRRALGHVDHILAVSECTAKDIRRYLLTLQLPAPPITVTKNGSSFAEFLPKDQRTGVATLRDLPRRFVLFVSTIEGRKNHRFIFDMWRRMVEAGDDPPHLICVGRLGWKAAAFVSDLVETNYLDRRIQLLRDISDTDLQLLYAKCLFTVCPSFYEGWGLPVGEALAMGKICVCSDRASIPEVAGNCGVYIDIDDAAAALTVVRDLIREKPVRDALEAKIRRDYVPITWRAVAQRVAAACQSAPAIEWQEPYPYPALPYSTEISFGRLDPNIDGKGESLLARITDARLGHFKFDPIDQRSFALGEEIRSAGAWAQPEPWGTWLCHGSGDMEFGLAADASQFFYVLVRLRVCGVLREQPMRLMANGATLWEGEVGTDSQDIMVRIPRTASGTGPWKLRIEAEMDISPEARAEIAAFDSRIPAIGFERLIVVPERDAITRLDIMTKRLL